MKRFLSFDCAHKSIANTNCVIDLEIYQKLSVYANRLLTTLAITPDQISVNAAATPTLNTLVAKGMQRRLVHPDFQRVSEPYTKCDDYITNQELLCIIYRMSMEVKLCIRIFHLEAKNLLGSSKVINVSEIDRLHTLYKYLEQSPVSSLKILPNTTTIIEHQPARVGVGGNKTNNASTAVSNQLAMYYVKHDPVFIDPKLKNTIAVGPNLDFDTFLKAGMVKFRVAEAVDASTRLKLSKSAKYWARKEHTKANFIYLLDKFGMSHELVNTPQALLDDAADSFMQIIAYVVHNGMFV